MEQEECGALFVAELVKQAMKETVIVETSAAIVEGKVLKELLNVEDVAVLGKRTEN